jgi:glycogen debranching enzyme
MELFLGDAALVSLDSHDRGFWFGATLTNPDIATDEGMLSGQTVVVRRERVIGPNWTEKLQVTNHGRHRLRLPLVLRFSADFEDIFCVRGFKRQSERPRVESAVTADTVEFRYTGLDQVARVLEIAFHPAPAEVSPDHARYNLDLGPGESISLNLLIQMEESQAIEDRQAPEITAGDVLRSGWRSEGTSFESSNANLNALYRRCMDDLYSLRSNLGGHSFFAAGVPWFDALFGRDSLITGMGLMATHPASLRETLQLLASTQASEEDPTRDAEPGKIVHEVRCGELANIGEVPFGKYYGSIDATPLFVLACREYLRWTGDLDTIRAVFPALHRAVAWCARRMSANPGGWLAYNRESSNGLEHQGWKDSEDGICDSSGASPPGPIALIEVQAYAAAAFACYQELCDAAGETPAFEAPQRTGQLLASFNEHFLGVNGDAVLAIDGEGRQVWTPASNAGHVLWTGGCSETDAPAIAARLLASDLFSGWGVRTLGAAVPGFNPLGYHTGSVWPHDNAIIIAGFRRYGLVQPLQQLGSALLEGMMGFADGRVPELFSGDSRAGGPFPTPYPVASRPQAWAAASLPWVLTSLLGVTAESSDALHVVRPTLPGWLDWARLRNVRFGETTVDLFFRREGEHTTIEVERQVGRGSVILSPRWPIRPLVHV